MELPKIFGGRAAVREDNVTPLRDEMPTRPQTMSWPPIPPQAKHYEPPQPLIPVEIAHELTVSREIFVELLQVPPDARDRIMHMVEDMLKLYAPVEAENHPEGSPV